MSPVIPMTKLGRLLVADGVISEAVLEQGLAVQQESGRKLSLWLLAEQLVDESTLCRYLAQAAQVPFVSGAQLDTAAPEMAKYLASATAAELAVVPAELRDEGVVLVTAEPEGLDDLKALAGQMGHPVIPALAARSDIARALARLYGVTDTTLWMDADATKRAIDDAGRSLEAESPRERPPGDNDPTHELRRDDVQQWLASYRRRDDLAEEAPAQQASISPDEAVWEDETPADVPTVGLFVDPADLDERATLAYRSPLADVTGAAASKHDEGTGDDWEADTAPPQADPLRATVRFGSKVPSPTPAVADTTPAPAPGEAAGRVGGQDTLDAVASVAPEKVDTSDAALAETSDAHVAIQHDDEVTTPKAQAPAEPDDEPLPAGRPELCGIPGLVPPKPKAKPKPKPAPTPAGAGTRFSDRYQMVDRLGVGGMAEVWRARVLGAEGFRRMVVVKKILPEYTTNREFVEMFIDEAKIACQLSHPNIAQIYELAEEDGQYFMVMEYVDGPELETVFEFARQKGPKLPPSVVAYIIEQLCSGLDYAHRKTDEHGNPLHIIHRDVTPHNVLVSYEGHVKVIDFGIAKAAAKMNVTRVGYMKGKPGYIAPEQALGMKLDHRVDVFAAGILLYEMLTHRRLFSDSANPNEFKKLARFDVRPLLRWQLKLPSVLRTMAIKALQVRPGDRLPSAQDFANGLRGYLRKRKQDPRDELLKYLRTHLPPVGGWDGPSAL